MKRWFHRTGDLSLAALWVGVATFAVVDGLGAVPDPLAQPLRVALVLPLVVFVPGYALVATLFPRRRDPETDPGSAVELAGIERFVLSFVVSLGLVPLVAFVMNYTLGLTVLPILLSVATVTFVLLLTAYVRRVAAPVDARWGLTPITWVRRTVPYFTVDTSRFGRPGAFVPTTGTQRLFNVALVVALLTFFAGVGFAVVVPPASDEEFTELSVLGETEEGNLSTRAVPDTFQQGESTPLWVAIGNHEEERTSYTTVVTLDGEEVDRFSTTVDAGETKRVERSITPTEAGGNQTLRVHLYQGDPGQNPNPEEAYRTLRVYVTVQ
ncbi:DUF1616 domain-containing protein [Halobium salinum]|uniref:DUF1616 domain-containing protein n=1 Tax=Halobium salinum TaxID=1364940 RepID=A0ABD5PAL8_9EURY|nr:DUF1616 domain-containing protein [Halobium salinum]